MLQINSDEAHVAALYDYEPSQSRKQQAGISFCAQILSEDVDMEGLDNNDQDEEPDEEIKDKAFQKEFHNRIFIDQL